MGFVDFLTRKTKTKAKTTPSKATKDEYEIRIWRDAWCEWSYSVYQNGLYAFAGAYGEYFTKGSAKRAATKRIRNLTKEVKQPKVYKVRV